jgi:hypothetical protein
MFLQHVRFAPKAEIAQLYSGGFNPNFAFSATKRPSSTLRFSGSVSVSSSF